APPEQASWLLGDCYDYRNVTRALLEHGTADYSVVQPGTERLYAPGNGLTLSETQSNVSLTVDGRLVPKRTMLLPVVQMLPYALGREWGLLLFNWAQCLLLLLLAYWLARRYLGELPAMLGAIGFLACGNLRAFTFNVSPDIFGADLMLGGVLALW